MVLFEKFVIIYQLKEFKVVNRICKTQGENDVTIWFQSLDSNFIDCSKKGKTQPSFYIIMASFIDTSNEDELGQSEL